MLFDQKIENVTIFPGIFVRLIKTNFLPFHAGQTAEATNEIKPKAQTILVLFEVVKTPEFPSAAIERLIRKASAQEGANIRVSKSASLELAVLLEEYAVEVAVRAMKLAEHRGAKTISRGDVILAVKRE